MFNLMRVHQRKLWLVVTILVGVSLVLFYSATSHSTGGGGSDDVLQMYGRGYSQSDLQQRARKFNVALGLGLTDYASQLSGNNGQEMDFVINSIVIDHEGSRLGIKPSDDEIKDAIVHLPAFQTGGQFDPIQYKQITDKLLGPNGLSAGDLEALVANSLTFTRIKQLLSSVPAVTPAEVTLANRAFQPINGMTVTFDRATFLKNAKVTDAQVADYYKSNAANLVTPEWRTARYVTFDLPPDSAKLEGKAKIDAQEKVAQATEAFTDQAATDGFDKAAKAAGVKIETALPFDRSGNIKPVAGLDATAMMSAAGPAQAIAPTVFTLSSSSPISSAIQSGNQFIVAELGEVTPSRPKTLDETRADIVQQLTQVAAQAALEKTATKALSDLRAAMKSGKTFAEAAAAAGLQTQAFTNLAPNDQSTPADQHKFVMASVLNDNEISGLDPESGEYAVWLEKRLPADETKLKERGQEVFSGLLDRQQNILWYEWLNNAQKESGLHDLTSARG